MSKTVNPKTGEFCDFHLVGTVVFQKDKYGILDRREKYVWYAGDNLPKSIVRKGNSGDYKQGYVRIPEEYFDIKDKHKNLNGKIPVSMEDFKNEVRLVKECRNSNRDDINGDLSLSAIVDIIREEEPDFNLE